MSNYFSHNTAIIDDNVKIDKNTKIWHWTHVSSGAIIGKNCVLGQNVFIGQNVKIGNNVKIQNNVSVYENVEIEDDVFCGPSMVFTNVKYPRTFLNRKKNFVKTIVRKGTSFGANSTIVCGVVIGFYTFVGAGAVVVKDTKPYSIVTGVPAKQTGWISKHGSTLDLPLKGNSEAKCLISNVSYRLVNGRLQIKN